MKSINLFEVSQPVGTFYIGKMRACDLLSVFDIRRLSDGLGAQRDANVKKVGKIEDYCSHDDRVTFPTPIIVSVNSDSVDLKEIKSAENELNIDGLYCLEYEENQKIFNVIDGQHRLLGIKKSGLDLELPLVVMFDLTPEDEAYIFTTINQNQTKVDKSVIYSLFELSNERSSIKTCHDIAVVMNESENSPFYKKIKMLGKRKEKSETLSQAAFIDQLLPFFSKKSNGKADGIFYVFYEKGNDAAIVKIMMNYFSAISKVFCDDWNDSSKILTKTTGYGGLCKVFPELYAMGLANKNLTESFFESLFVKVKKSFDQNYVEFSSKQFGLGDAAQNELARKILECFKE